jgi:integrase
MGLFRRAIGTCPKCRKEKRADVGVKHPKARNWNLTCTCGKKLTAHVELDWWISFRDLEGRYRRRKIGPDKQAAERILAKIKVEIAEGRYIDRKATFKVTLGELVDKYLPYVKNVRKKRSYASEKAAWKHVMKFFSRGILINKIGESESEAYRLNRSKEGAAVATINRELVNLSSALSWAVKKGMLEKKPIFRMPNPHNERERFITKEEARRLISFCHHRIDLIVQTALFTGMRLGEILKMEWSWIDQQNRMINIPPTATKTGKGRHVPISDDMQLVLEEARKRKVKRCSYIFHLSGKARPGWTITTRWRSAAAKAGLKGLRFHDLRHTAASWLVMGGEDLHTVATILGHSSLDMTRRYAHLAPGHLRKAIKNVDVGLAQADGISKADKGDGHLLNTGKVLQFRYPSEVARHRPGAAKKSRSRGSAPRPQNYPTPNATGVADLGA